jgi:hypothetical protein
MVMDLIRTRKTKEMLYDGKEAGNLGNPSGIPLEEDCMRY